MVTHISNIATPRYSWLNDVRHRHDRELCFELRRVPDTKLQQIKRCRLFTLKTKTMTSFNPGHLKSFVRTVLFWEQSDVMHCFGRVAGASISKEPVLRGQAHERQFCFDWQSFAFLWHSFDLLQHNFFADLFDLLQFSPSRAEHRQKWTQWMMSMFVLRSTKVNGCLRGFICCNFALLLGNVLCTSPSRCLEHGHRAQAPGGGGALA